MYVNTNSLNVQIAPTIFISLGGQMRNNIVTNNLRCSSDVRRAMKLAPTHMLQIRCKLMLANEPLASVSWLDSFPVNWLKFLSIEKCLCEFYLITTFNSLHASSCRAHVMYLSVLHKCWSSNIYVQALTLVLYSLSTCIWVVQYVSLIITFYEN